MLETPENLPQHWVNRLGFALRRELVRRFQSAGISASAEEWGAMLILNGGPCTPSQLSDRTLRDRTTVTRLIDRLVRAGLVRRDTNPTDRRRHTLRLTREGYTQYGDMARIAADLVAETQRGLDRAEVERTVATLRKMFLNLTGADDD